MDFGKGLNEQGYAIEPAVFSHDLLDRLVSEIDKCSPKRSRAGIRHALALTPVAAFAKCAALIDRVREILGKSAFPYRATLFEKSPLANWLVVWHQDTALPLRRRVDISGWGPWSIKEGIHYAHAPAAALAEVLTLRVHLDNSLATNGPLRVLPGTHTFGVLSDDQIHELSKNLSAIDCVVRKGGVVAMRPLIVHSSSKSQTDHPRRVLHIEYAASDKATAPMELAIA